MKQAKQTKTNLLNPKLSYDNVMDAAVDVVPRVNFVVPGDGENRGDIGSINGDSSNSDMSSGWGGGVEGEDGCLSIANKSSSTYQLRSEKNLRNAKTECEVQEH